MWKLGFRKLLIDEHFVISNRFVKSGKTLENLLALSVESKM